jgi:hypothetical protein
MTAYYSSMLNTMIQDWRDRKGMGDFAFVVMQVNAQRAGTEEPGPNPLSQRSCRRRSLPALRSRSSLNWAGCRFASQRPAVSYPTLDPVS